MHTPNSELPHPPDDVLPPQEATPAPQGNAAERRHLPRLAQYAAVAGIALALSGCLRPSGEAASGHVHEQTLAVADEPGAQAMFASLTDAMGNTVHVAQPSSHQGEPVDTDTGIKLRTAFDEWALRKGADPAPSGVPAPGDAVLTRAGDIGYIYKVTTDIDQFGGTTAQTITLVGGAELSLDDLLGRARAQLPFPEGDTQPQQAATPAKPPASHRAPKSSPTAEAKSTPANIEKARADVVNVINLELNGKGRRSGHAGQSPYAITASGHSEWPELMDYINKANSGNWLGSEPDWCSLLVSFVLDRAGHPLSGGDSGNPTALYRVANVFGSPPVKDMTLQEWVIKNGTYWS